MTTFLPVDYKAPKTNSSYMKLAMGENKIRILSKPIMGWEDWIDNKPVRFSMDEKPASAHDPKKPIKHFWAFIVWNYSDKQIQILQLTQASIRSSIETLCRDPDWAEPYFYDIKINKKGEKMDTEYVVNPLPHKPIGEEIIKCFHDKPCNLMALFDGSDPFSHLSDTFTPGVFVKSKELELIPLPEPLLQIEKDIPKFTADQCVKLTNALKECDEDYKKQVWEFWKSQYQIISMNDLPADQYEVFMKGAANRAKENKKMKAS